MKKTLFIITFIIILSFSLLIKNFLNRYDTKILLTLAHCPKSKFSGNQELHSQFYEDYILSYLFANKSKGFYVDVGTHYPEIENATHFFHLKGWQGINIEPIKELYDLIQNSRPNAININKAVSNFKGHDIFYILPKAIGLSSLNQEIKQIGQERGLEVEQRKVEVTTLTQILNENEISSEISFIKIDVENHEDKVLEGLDLKKYRPEILIIETVSPTNLYGHLKWEPILTQNGYLFGANDGLNRYYFRKENPELKERFQYIIKCVKAEKLIRNVSCDHREECNH